MRFTINPADQYTHLADVKPGDRVTIRAFVQSVSVEAIDVTTLGNRGPQHVKGETTVDCIIEDVTKLSVT